jgi:hypothetical protein
LTVSFMNICPADRVHRLPEQANAPARWRADDRL